MIVLSETKLDKETINKYKRKGYRVSTVFDNLYIKPKESVGIYLDKLYKPTIDLIERLLYFKHTVTLKYQGQAYILNSLEDWKYTHQSDKDQIKTTTEFHPILKAYREQRKEYLQDIADTKARIRHDLLVPKQLPDDLDTYLSTFASRYDIRYEDNTLSKYLAYEQIKFYIDNNIPYTNPAPVIDPQETPLYSLQFNYNTTTVEEPEIISFGDETYFEDFVNKSIFLDKLLDYTE